MPTQVLEVDWVILYFVYGLVFFVMGLVTGLQSRRRSRLELARALPWLAGFGLAHGLVEWGYIFIPLQAQHLYGESSLSGFSLLNYIFVPLQTQYNLPPLVVLMVAAHLLLLAVSFFCLFQFGVELLLPLFPRQRWLRAVPGAILCLWAIALVIRAVTQSEPLNVLVAVGDAWSRYLLCFPGAILAHLGLLRQARQVRAMGLPQIAVYLTGAAVAFSVYALAGGLLVPAAPFFPANWLNYPLLMETIGVPAPVFRSVCGLAMAFFIVRSLDIFEIETDRLIADMEQERILAVDRERIGRELHDGVIQNIYSAGLVLEDADHLIVEDPGLARQRVHSVMGTLNQTIDEIRGYILDLRTPPLCELQAGLRSLVRDLRLDTMLEVDYQITEQCPRQLTPQQIANLTQIAREALRNVVQHADARRVVVSLQCDDQQVCLAVTDDGKGLDPALPAGAGRRGWGIANMRARADQMGGQFTLDSAPGQGVRLTVTAPYGNGRERSEVR
jgi:signal transduction histidine kinase